MSKFVFSDLTGLDKRTKLMWTRDANISGMVMIWNEAFKFVEELNEQKYAGYSNWRLPSKNELLTLVDFTEGQGHTKSFDEYFNEIGFKNVQSNRYWSSTTSAPTPDDAWIVLMYDGLVANLLKTNFFYVWPVRSQGLMIRIFGNWF